MKDNFSGQAALYAKYRPGYPGKLFDFLLQQVNERNTAWDCATGNGQTAKDLALHFNKVLATDSSRQQLDDAVKTPVFVNQLSQRNIQVSITTVLTSLLFLRHCTGCNMMRFMRK